MDKIRVWHNRPKPYNRKTPKNLPFDKLKVGSCFFIPEDKEHKTKLLQRIKMDAYNFKKREKKEWVFDIFPGKAHHTENRLVDGVWIYREK